MSYLIFKVYLLNSLLKSSICLAVQIYHEEARETAHRQIIATFDESREELLTRIIF